ncbi:MULTISPECIES: bile acid:sodium symporter family protein [Brevibacillus]|uniref:Bile acid:sodium symporter n=1 Tax=Brevibacillus parabrevis TaxID=54914 RepID=A0A4Y3PFY9_BREPA|nr:MULTISPECIES: bile acid:sodium symporter family protein [Brevibacillus]MBU8712429.1 bile acid:sodium symporter family protein [Brevibacillus parabrevis]MED2257229.1 bile acid:sodium symporter family protein [Brevibacillus parabrevis]NRQ52527.1 bile acid:sodium symporter family protein [Brevibacillus sp. HD1.4A]RNB96030.1 bile acid:sodium symporter family protein [Brevibacillus parabrevis]UED71718.1 bile acid:sodium symporter family protein [Brevibacillus sp. HD3.3A]
MDVFAKVNKSLEKIMPLLTPSSVAIGVLAGSHLQPFAFLSPWVFAFMTFAGSLGSGFKEFAKVLARPLPLLVNLMILHVIMPFIAWGVAHLFYPDDVHVITGFLLAALIPTGISSFLWSSIYMGNVALTLSIILLDTMISPLVVPFGMYVLLGAKVEMDTWDMMQGLFFMIVLPSLAGMLLHHLSRGRVKQTLAPKLSPFSKLGMGVVVAINSSMVSNYFQAWDAKLFGMAVLVLLLAILGYLLGWWMARLFGWERDVIVALTFNSGMRNISAGAVMAITYFPATVALPVVLGMLFQQTLASTFGKFLDVVEKRPQPIGKEVAQ